MSIWVEQPFISRLCSRFRNYKQQKPNLYNFSCPICGDSKKHLRKARGFIYESKQSYNYKCHNCGAGMSFGSFLKLMDPVLHEEYRMELYKENGGGVKLAKEEVVVEKPKSKQPKALRLMRSLLKLPADHPAIQYVTDRKIPENKWKYLFYVPRYYAWMHKIDPEVEIPEKDHPRLIIPYFDKKYGIYRLTARALGNEVPKYLFHVIDDEKPSLYNYEFINPEARVYVVEGQIDSFFLPNCIAVGNASYGSPELRKLSDKVIVPDNQPRNKDVTAQIKKVIDLGYPICLWDKEYAKDLGEMAEFGYTPDEIKTIVDRCTVQGAAAQLRFAQWCRS